MDINTIRQRLYDYVSMADDKELKAIYTIIADEIDTMTNTLEDKMLMADIKRRGAEMKSGKIKTYTLEETKAMARKKGASKKVA